MTRTVTFTAETSGVGLTPDSMAAALKHLAQLTVPGDAKLKVNHFTANNRWELKATWTQQIKDEDAAPISASANLDAAVSAASATQRVRAIQERIQVEGRKVKDFPRLR